MKYFRFIPFIFIVFACNVNDLDLPNTNDTGGGDDEDPIIQGGGVWPDGSAVSDTLISVVKFSSNELVDCSITDESGNFTVNGLMGQPLKLQVVFPDGSFRESTRPFFMDSLPNNIVIQ